MGSSSRWAALAAAVLLGACAAPQRASPTGPPPALTLSTLEGAPLPFGALLGEAEATLLVFWSPGCPCVRRYQERVESLKAELTPRGIQVVGIASNADDTPERIQTALLERGVSLRVLRDEGGALASALGARTTPSVVLLRRDGEVLFHGWIDNERLPGEPDRKAFAEDAAMAFLEGRAGPTSSRVYGCTITRRLGAAGNTCHAAPAAALEHP